MRLGDMSRCARATAIWLPNSRMVSSGVYDGSSARVTPSRLNSALASSVISAGSRSPLRNERSITSNSSRPACTSAAVSSRFRATSAAISLV
jgi:hypothetical protein